MLIFSFGFYMLKNVEIDFGNYLYKKTSND